jgi:hypothetical protein
MSDHAGHVRRECKHGKVVLQCRCATHKPVEIVQCPPKCFGMGGVAEAPAAKASRLLAEHLEEELGIQRKANLLLAEESVSLKDFEALELKVEQLQLERTNLLAELKEARKDIGDPMEGRPF